MTAKTLSELIGQSSEKAPSAMLGYLAVGNVNIGGRFGTETTAAISTTAYAEVINIAGSGYFEMLIIDSSGTQPPGRGKAKIVVDGVTVFDARMQNSFGSGLAASRVFKFVGGVSENYGGEGSGTLHFKSSFVLSLSGNGYSNSCKANYRRVLT